MIEDDPAVRKGINRLLTSLGARAHAFESAAVAIAWVAAREYSTHRPDLLIVDYRLEGTETGVDAILALRQEFGVALPAIMITASDVVQHEATAALHNFHVLMKPVAPSKLRALIGFKLAQMQLPSM